MRIFLVLLSVLLSSHLFAKDKHVDLSGPAYDFTLKSNSGENIRLSDLRGQVVMLNFWASWCGPCRQEMPLLDKLAQRYEAAGFKLLGVNTEASRKAADGFLKDTPVSFSILYDSTKQVSDTYKVDAMPTTVMIDCDGNLNYLHRGYVAGDEKLYKKKIRQLLAACR